MRFHRAVAAAAMLLTGCAGQSAQHHARLSTSEDLRIDSASLIAARNGASGAPVNGLSIGGYLVNESTAPLRCRASAFILIDQAGNAVAPQSLFCTIPVLGPHLSTSFNAEFATVQGTRLQLRFEHPDGTYENHTLTVPRE